MSHLDDIQPLLNLQPKKGPLECGFCDLTPPIATELLIRNPPNRPLKPARINEYKISLITHRWLDAGEPMQLTREGHMINGRNRCTAVVETGITARNQLIVIGVDPRAVTVIDTGKPRNLGDTVFNAGGRYCNRIASLISMAWAVDTLSLTASNIGRAPPNDIGDYLFRSDRDAFDRAVGLTLKTYIGILTPKLCSWLVYVTDFEALDWVENVANATNLKANTGGSLFHKRIMTTLSKVERLTIGDTWPLLIKAYENDVRGKRMSILRMLPEEDMPKLDPIWAPKAGMNHWPLDKPVEPRDNI